MFSSTMSRDLHHHRLRRLPRYATVRVQSSLPLFLTLTVFLKTSLPFASSSLSSASEYDCRDLKEDVASKAVVSPIIFEGRARRIETPTSWGSNQNQKPFNVTFRPKVVYKGDLPKVEGGTDYGSILVGKFGPAEDLNSCIPSVHIGSRYIVFLKPRSGYSQNSEESLPYYEINHFPERTSKKALRHVIAYGCINCTFPPRIEPFIETKVHLLTSQRLLLHCVTSGKPIPVVTWYKNRIPLTNSSRKINIKNKRDGSSLDIERVDSQDSGLYRCNAKNILGEVLSDPVDVNITPSELEYCSNQGYCFNGGHCYVVPKTGRKICECQKNFTGVRCQEPNLMEHFLLMKQTYEFFERRLEGLVMTSILLIIILILLFFISAVCISKRKNYCDSNGCKHVSSHANRSNVSTWNDSAAQTDRHYENVNMNQPLSPRTHDAATAAISPDNPQRLSWIEKSQNMIVSSEACVIVGAQPPRTSNAPALASVLPNKVLDSKKSKCDECKIEDVSKRSSSVFVDSEAKELLDRKTFRNHNQPDGVATRGEDGKDVKSKNIGSKLVNRDSGIDVRASRVTTSEALQASELLELRLSEEVVGCCEIEGLNIKEDIHIYSNTPLETSTPIPRPTVVEILEQLRNNNDLQLVTPNKLSSIFQACKDKEKLLMKSAKDVSCGCPESPSANARTQEEKPKLPMVGSEKNNKRLSCNVEVQTDKRCKELLSHNKSELQKRKSCYVISSAVNGVVFTEIEKMENPSKNQKSKRSNLVEPLNSVAEEEKLNLRLAKPDKRKQERGLKVSIEARPLKRDHEKEEVTPKNPEVPPKFSPSYQEVLKQCGNSLSDYKLNQKDIKLHKKRSESAFPFSEKEVSQGPGQGQEHAPNGIVAERTTKNGAKEYAKHRANSTSTDNSTSYNHFPQRNSKVLDIRPKTSSPIPNGHFQFFPSSQNEKDFVSPPIPAKKFTTPFLKESDRYQHRNENNLLAHQLADQQTKIEKYFSPPSIPSQNSRVSKIPLRNHEDCHPLLFSNSKFQINSSADCDAEDRKRPHPHSNASDLSSADVASKSSPQDAARSSFRQSPSQSVAGLRNAFENMSSNYKITSPADQSYIQKAKPSYRLFSNQLSSMIPFKDHGNDTQPERTTGMPESNVLGDVERKTVNSDAVGNEYDALYSTDERSVSCSECDCRISQASDLEVNRESEVDILTLNASEEELLDLQLKKQEKRSSDKAVPTTRDKSKTKYLSGSTFAKKCVELCRENSSEKNEKQGFEKADSKQELLRGLTKTDKVDEVDKGEISGQFRRDEEFSKKDGKLAPVASSDEYGESSADSSDSEDSSISSNDAERGIDMLFERLKLDNSDDLLAAVEAMQSHRQSESSSDRVIEFPSFDWEKAPCCPFSFESLDRTFTLNPYDLMYAHKYAASQNRSDCPDMADGQCAGATGIGSPFRKNGELGLPSPPKFHFDFDSDTTVA